MPIKPGPTGVYPQGRPLAAGDLGRVMIAVRVRRASRMIEWDFGTRASFVLMRHDEARYTAIALRELVQRHFGAVKHVDEGFPMKVENYDALTVKLTLPHSCEMLVGNPEVFLVLADRLDALLATGAGNSAFGKGKPR